MLPSAFVLPYSVRLAVYTGGGVSFGYEKQVFLVRPLASALERNGNGRG